jgi:hypothetical protein
VQSLRASIVRERQAKQAQAISQDILGTTREVGAQSLDRMRNEELLADFYSNLNTTLGAVAPVTDGPSTARPTSGLLSNVFAGLGRFQDITEGIGGFAAEGVQKIIPGKQGLEANIERLRAEGVGPFAAREQAFEEQDLPSVRVDVTPGFHIPLPGGRKLDEVDLGVKGAIELVADPLNLAILLSAGTLAPLKGGQISAKIFRMAGIPGSSKWIRTAKAATPDQSDLLQANARMISNDVTPSMGRISPEANSGSILDKALDAEAAFKKNKPSASIVTHARHFLRKVQEWTTDDFNVSERLQSNYRKQMKKEGLPPDPKMDAAVHANLMRGSYSAGINKAKVAVERAIRHVKGIDPKYLTLYLQARHADEVLKMFPDRKPPAPYENAADVAQLLTDMEIKVGHTQMLKVKAGAQEIFNFYQSQLDERVHAGLISKTMAEELKTKYPFYNPIRYLLDEEQILNGQNIPFATSGKTISVASNDIKRLGNAGVDAILEDPLETIYHVAGRTELHMRRNRAAYAMVHAAMYDKESKSIVQRIFPTQEVSNATPTMSYMEGGTVMRWAVTKDMEQMAKQFAQTNFHSLETTGRFLNAIPRAMLITYNPAFLAANFIFDAMTVAVTHNVLPHSVFNAARKNLMSIFKADEGFNKFIQAGSDVSGFYGKGLREQVRIANKGGNLGIRTESEWRQLLTHPLELWREVTHSLELAPRRAVFEAGIRRGKTEDTAALWARRSAVDFERAGHAVRLANSYYLFLNPAIQGTLLPFRAAFTSDHRARALVGLSGFLGANVGAYAWNSQFEEYNDIPAFDRLGKTLIMLPSEEKDSRGNTVPHYIAVVPMLREFAAFAGPVNYMLDRLRGESPDSFQALIDTVLDQANPLDPVSRLPVPTFIGQSLTELALNRDTFRGREIIPTDLQGLPAIQQFDERTSDTARRIGEWFGWSPMKIDHLMKTGTGRDIFALTDMTIRETVGQNVEAQAIVASLADMQEFLEPGEFRRLRNTILSDIDAETRRAVEVEEKRPEPDIPIATTVINRFYRKYGGNLYRAGLEQAARDAKMSVDQLRHTNNVLHELSIDLQQAQLTSDDNLNTGQINGKQWRDERKDSSSIYAGAIASLGLQYPPLKNFLDDSQQRQLFYDKVNTLSGQIKDRRDRGQWLIATFNGIPIPEIAPGVEDWPSFFNMREAFLQTLSVEDRSLLQAEREDGMTEEERRFDSMVSPDAHGRMGLAAAYWGAPESVFNDPQLAADYRVFESVSGDLRERMKQMRPELAAAGPLVLQIRSNLRLVSQELDEFLIHYGYVDVAQNPENEGREAEFAPWQIRAGELLEEGAIG